MIADELKRQILQAVKTAYPEVAIKPEEISLEHPGADEHGDYSTNVALRLCKQVGEKPVEAAKKIVALLAREIKERKQDKGILEKIEIAGPGFINFTLSTEALITQMSQALEADECYGELARNNKTIAIEIVSPNINKPLHIGHLRNGALGMSLANLCQVSGWKVIRDEINNDRGLHIMKAAYGYLLFGSKQPQRTQEWQQLLDAWINNSKDWKVPEEEGKKPDFFVGGYYVLGEKFLTENEELANKQLAQMLQAWESEDPKIWRLWKVLGDWVHDGIDQTYKRIGVTHDKKWYEYLLYKEGKEYILEAANKGVFEKLPDGAVQANLEKYGLANKILVRRDGTAIYMTFDIALTKHKVAEFNADQYVWVVGNEQLDHFKRLFVIFEMLGLGSKDKFFHLAYGMVRVPGGKMSSRLGNVILADDLLDKMVEIAKKLMSERKIGKDVDQEEKEKIAEAVGVGAVKYAMLKVSPMMDVVFDLEKSVSLDGDSGPYLQYTYARARSVIRKAETENLKFKIHNLNSNFKFAARSFGTQISNLKTEELAVMRFLYRFPEVVEAAARTYSPNLVCTYLFELAKRFNSFYNEIPILKGSREDQGNRGNEGHEETKRLRLALTQATSIILKNGLKLLGIEAPEKM